MTGPGRAEGAPLGPPQTIRPSACSRIARAGALRPRPATECRPCPRPDHQHRSDQQRQEVATRKGQGGRANDRARRTALDEEAQHLIRVLRRILFANGPLRLVARDVGALVVRRGVVGVAVGALGLVARDVRALVVRRGVVGVATRVGRIALAHALIAVALVTGVVIASVRVLTLSATGARILVVGIPHTACTRLARRFPASVAVGSGALVRRTRVVVGATLVRPVTGVAVLRAVTVRPSDTALGSITLGLWAG